MEKMTWLLVIMGIAGVILNNHKDPRCFYLWGITNAGWVAWDWWHGLYSQAVLFFIYFLLAIHGLWKWRRTASISKTGLRYARNCFLKHSLTTKK